MAEKPYKHIDTIPDEIKESGEPILVWCEAHQSWLPVFSNPGGYQDGEWDSWCGATPEPGHAVWWQPMPADPDREETEAAWNALPEPDEEGV